MYLIWMGLRELEPLGVIAIVPGLVYDGEHDQPMALQAVTVLACTPCLTREDATALVVRAPLIPRVSLTELGATDPQEDQGCPGARVRR